jgi:hypothetical protein
MGCLIEVIILDQNVFQNPPEQSTLKERALGRHSTEYYFSLYKFPYF